MERFFKLVNRVIPMRGHPLVFDNWITMIFPITENRPKLGRWRNVSKGTENGDVHDPGYESSMADGPAVRKKGISVSKTAPVAFFSESG